MSKAAFWEKGESLDYINNTDAVIEANTIVVYGERIGVVGCDINPGDLGSVHVTGVFEMPKADAAEVGAGRNVFWNEEAQAATGSPGSSPADARLKIGFAAQASAADDTTVLVKINA